MPGRLRRDREATIAAALIPDHLVPVARTDADWAFDIDFEGEDWTGSQVQVAFARQKLPVCVFQIEAEAPTADMACSIFIPEAGWDDRPPGSYTVEVRRIRDGATDDAAVFTLELVRGVSDLVTTPGAAVPPIGDGVAIGSVVVTRGATLSVTRGAAGPRGPIGPAGDGLIRRFALGAVSGHRVVREEAGGRCSYASSTRVIDAEAVIGITVGAASDGADVAIAAGQTILEPSWAFTPGPVFLGSDGYLVQPAPIDRPFVLQVGVALSPTQVLAVRRAPIYS